MKKVTREQLVNAANELNDEFGLEPAIKTGKSAKDESIKEGIVCATAMYDPDNDELTPETIAVMEALKGDEEPEAEEEVEEEEVEEEEVEEEEVEEEEVEEAEAPLAETSKKGKSGNPASKAEMVEAFKTAKKRDALVDLLEDEFFDDVRAEFEKENNPIKLKSAMRKYIGGGTASIPVKTKRNSVKSTKSEEDSGVIAAIEDWIAAAGKKGVSRTDISKFLLLIFLNEMKSQ
ncbi:MAG: hypothetical protein PHG64_12360 [Paludibacter sp.]|nr:hypothetical protein [Paludibacter sp.]